MQKNELIVNGVSLDLAPNTVVGITYQANNIGEIQNRQGDYSNTFKLPFTEKNRVFFENAENVNSGTLIPYRTFTASYYESGLPIIRDGVLTLIETDNGYSVRLNSGNTDFFKLLGDATVGDLYAGESHVMNFDTIIASLDESQNYIYPTVDFRKYPEASPLPLWDDGMDVRWFRPFLFVKKILERMADVYDYNIVGSFVDSDICQKLLFSPDNCVNDENVTYEFFSSIDIPGYVLLGTIPEAPTGDSFTYFEEVNSSPNTELTATVGGITTPIGGAGTMKLKYDFQAFIRMTEDPIIEYDRQKGITVQILKVGTGVIASDVLVSDSLYAEDWFYTALGTLNLPYTVNEGDQYFARVLFEIQEADNTGFDFGFNTAGLFELTFIPDVNMNYGSIVLLQNCYTMKQKDFLKDLMNMFCILPQTNTFTRTISFNFLDDLLVKMGSSLDWSSKIDTRQINVTYQWGDYAQKNNFLYKDVPNVIDFYQPKFGRGTFFIDDKNLPIEKTVVQLNTSAVEMSADNYICSIQAVEPLTGEWSNPNNRFLVLDRKPYLEDYYKTLIDTYGNTYFDENPVIPYFFFGANNSLGFSFLFTMDIGLLDKFYKVIQQVNYKSKYIEVFAFLNSNDIRNIDFTIPIFLNVQHKKVNINGYFYLNIVSQYRGGLTKIGLVRL